MELHKQSDQISYKILVIKIHDIEMCLSFFPFLGQRHNITKQLYIMCLQTFKASAWVTKGLLKSNLLVIATLHLLIIE